MVNAAINKSTYTCKDSTKWLFFLNAEYEKGKDKENR